MAKSENSKTGNKKQGGSLKRDNRKIKVTQTALLPEMPSRTEIIDQLKNIANSGVFHLQGGETDELRVFRHIVYEMLEGQKSTQASILVFLEIERADYEKPNSQARVVVASIRNKIARYYDELGWRSPVEIEIPKGQYWPRFSYRKPEDQIGHLAEAALRHAQAASDKQTLPACEEALKHLQEIIEKQEDNVYALAVKADVHIIRAIQGMPPKPELEAAAALASSALKVSGKRWQAHNAAGAVHAVFRRWPEAARAFKRARQLRQLTHPDAVEHFLYIAFLVSQGHLVKAMQLSEITAKGVKGGYYGVTVLPNPVIRADFGLLQVLSDESEAAKATLESAIKDSPQDFYMPYYYLALAYESQDDHQSAAAVLDDLPLSLDQSGVTWGAKALFNGLAGDKRRAREELAKLQAASAQGHFVPAREFAIAYLGIGEHRDALVWLRQMARDYDPVILWLSYLPVLRHLTGLKEFHTILKEEMRIEWRWRRLKSK